MPSESIARSELKIQSSKSKIILGVFGILTSCVILLAMTGEIKRDEERPPDLQIFIEQGFSVASGLRSEAGSARNRVETAQSVESKIINHETSRIIGLTADRIQEQLDFLQQRLSKFRPDPEA